jgi:predicted anti-sigma-YlaC factor YlaD
MGIADRIRFALDHRWSPPHMSEFLDGDLDERGSARIDRHVRDCRECRELLRSLQAIVEELGGLRAETGEPVAGVLLESVRSRLRDAP